MVLEKYKHKQKEYNKKYYDKHKQILNEKIKCALCNGSYSKINYYHHIKSKKHLKCC